VNYTYVQTDEELSDLARRLHDVPRVAFDSEANSLHNYHERVCLIQLSAGDRNFLVDPLGGGDLEDLIKRLARIDLIIHGADYDLRLMRSTFDFVPKGAVFDTMLAAQLLGMERIGYAALVEHFFDVQISKSGQKSNWARRPLTEAQLAYAADDTRYLGPLADLLRDELESRGRLEWHEEWCKRIVKAASEAAPRTDDEAWRIRGTGTLKPKQLVFVKEIWRWREQQAERADTPPFKILGNQQLIELAMWAAAHPGQDLDKGPRLPRNCEGRRLQALKAAIRRGHGLPKDKWPERFKRQKKSYTGPECKPQIEALRAESARVAADLGIPAAVLAPKAMIVNIARSNARTRHDMQASAGMMNWQVALLEEPLRAVLEKFDEKN
jgi:ribonuclease D